MSLGSTPAKLWLPAPKPAPGELPPESSRLRVDLGVWQALVLLELNAQKSLVSLGGRQ